MKKTQINYIVDILALVSFVVTAITGLVLKFFLPSGVRQSRLQEFWGIPKGTWTEIHDWFGILFIIFTLIHLVLHWNWIVCMTKNIFTSDNKECEIKK